MQYVQAVDCSRHGKVGLRLCKSLCHCLQVFLLGGSWSGGVATATYKKIGEVYDGSSWRTLNNVDAVPIRTGDSRGPYRADNHAWLFGWSQNRGTLLCPLMCCPCTLAS